MFFDAAGLLSLIQGAGVESMIETAGDFPTTTRVHPEQIIHRQRKQVLQMRIYKDVFEGLCKRKLSDSSQVFIIGGVILRRFSATLTVECADKAQHYNNTILPGTN
jgi:hypothetical protein